MSECAKHVSAERPAPGVVAAAADLEFPDWNGGRRRPSTLGMDEMLRYCEAMLPYVRSFPGWRQRRLAGRCNAEFNL